MPTPAQRRDNLVALVYSFSDDLLAVPYAITRDAGKPLTRGKLMRGKPSILWQCSCPYNSIRGVACKHLRTLWASVQRGAVDQRYTLTALGETLVNTALEQAAQRLKKRA
jgi:hypothetical protein